MKLGKVVGKVVSSYSYPVLSAKTLLLVEEINDDLSPTGKYLVAADAVGAGAGEFVIMTTGGLEAGLVFEERIVPSDATIIGILDKIGKKSATK